MFIQWYLGHNCWSLKKFLPPSVSASHRSRSLCGEENNLRRDTSWMWPSEPHPKSASVDTTVSCVNVRERSLLHSPLHVRFRSWLCAAHTPARTSLQHVPDVRHDGASHYTQSLIVLIIWTEACYCEVCFNLAGCIARLVYLWSDTQTLASTASAVLTSFHLPQSKGVYVTHT